MVLSGLIAIGALYALLLLPILLSWIGPSSVILQCDKRISDPIPFGEGSSSSTGRKKQKRLGLSSSEDHYFSQKSFKRVQSEISLSTISEESHSVGGHYHSSHEIHLLQPEVVVETTTVTNGHQAGSSYPLYSTTSFTTSEDNVSHDFCASGSIQIALL